MKQIVLPGTDLEVSSLCLGAGPIGSAVDQGESYRLLDAFLDHGGNFVDSALVYANWLPIEKSISEKTIGRWMKLRGNRGRVVVGTKGAHPDLAAMHVSRLSPGEIVGDLEASLRHLQTDRIDLYWLHRDDPHRPAGEIVETLNGQVIAGKVRWFGCSNWRAPRIREAQAYAAGHGLRGFVADQMMWSAAVVDPQAIADRTIVVMDDSLRQLHRSLPGCGGRFRQAVEGGQAVPGEPLHNCCRGGRELRSARPPKTGAPAANPDG